MPTSPRCSPRRWPPRRPHRPEVRAAHRLGGFADDALLASERLSPVKLLDSGYRFLSTDLMASLKVMLAA